MALQKSTYNESATWEGLKALNRSARSARSNVPQGPYLLYFEVALDAADLGLNDEVLIAKVPTVGVELGIYLVGYKVSLTDVDTNGAPAHVADFKAGANVLISGSVIGKAGGIDELDALNAMKYEDIQGLDLTMESTTAAATAAAGTLKVWLEVIIGRFSETGS